MVAYVVIAKDPNTEELRFDSLSTNLESAKNSAREKAKREIVKVFVFEVGKPMFRVDEHGNEIKP
jgi:transposase